MRTSIFAIIAALLNIFSNLHAEHIADTIDDPICDAAAQAAFSSTDFSNTILHYRLGGMDYKVRLIHNPERTTFTAAQRHPSPYYWEDTCIFILRWRAKYGILVDQIAPQELIDHLSQFTNASWRDWYFSFKVCNGTYVKYVDSVTQCGSGRQCYTEQKIYQLDTWFNYMSNPYKSIRNDLRDPDEPIRFVDF